MSALNIFLASLLLISDNLPGSLLTHKARDHFCRLFAALVHNAGYRHIRSAAEIRIRHVRIFLLERQRAQVSSRTVCNQLVHLRRILRVAGNHQVFEQLNVPNCELGIGRSSRLGSKTSMGDTEFSELLARIESPALRALLGLERAVGLRAMEAIRAGRCLLVWQAQLILGMNSIDVVFGTKGGRVRTTRLPDVQRALNAIQDAISVMNRHNRLAPTKTLKQAASWYRNYMYRLDAQGHRLRYSFACACVDFYRAQGRSEGEAYARTAMDLGHGDGRGRWVKMVYCRERILAKP